MELVAERTFLADGREGSTLEITLGFKPDWRFTKKIRTYRNGKLVSETKWCTLNKQLDEPQTPERAREALETLEKEFKKEWKG